MEIEKQKNIKGFTLIEMLVVVLIIGILAGIALPQYQMAVTKAKVASILPIMRRWSDAYQEYYLQHNSYLTEEGDVPDTDTLGVSWPSDWTCDDNGIVCSKDNITCASNENAVGDVGCTYFFTNTDWANINFYQANALDEDGYMFTTRQCLGPGGKAQKLCKALGGKYIDEDRYSL